MLIIDKKTTLDTLARTLGADKLTFDATAREQYGRDRTTSHQARPCAIAFPSTTDDVVSIVNFANKTQTPLVPSGGRTGYSGGAVASNNELVVSFDRMNNIIDFDEDSQQLLCQPGVKTQTIQQVAHDNGLFYPVDYAATKQCQIGGNIATNAGGIHVIHYGSTRRWIAGLQVVTGEGKILNLNAGLLKNSSGYDLRHLFIGSEGTLGLITAATIQLTKAEKSTKTVFMTVTEKENLIKILNIFRRTVTVTAFEFFDQASMDYTTKSQQLNSPFKTASSEYALLTYESGTNQDSMIQQALKHCHTRNYIDEQKIGHTTKDSEYFWRFRLGISSALQEHRPYKYDIAVTPRHVAPLILDINNFFSRLKIKLSTVWWGHIGDGNLHLNILKPESIMNENFLDVCQTISNEIYTIVGQYHGTISAEHGIGLIKKPFLHHMKSPSEIDYMRKIKAIFDPNNILNPGKLLPDSNAKRG